MSDPRADKAWRMLAARLGRIPGGESGAQERAGPAPDVSESGSPESGAEPRAWTLELAEQVLSAQQDVPLNKRFLQEVLQRVAMRRSPWGGLERRCREPWVEPFEVHAWVPAASGDVRLELSRVTASWAPSTGEACWATRLDSFSGELNQHRLERLDAADPHGSSWDGLPIWYGQRSDAETWERLGQSATRSEARFSWEILEQFEQAYAATIAVCGDLPDSQIDAATNDLHDPTKYAERN